MWRRDGWYFEGHYHGGMKRVCLAGLIVVAIVGCHSTPSAKTAANQHPVRGVVMGVNAAKQEISLKNEAIVGFMAPMTMEYKVTDPSAVQEMHVGDTIAATLLDDADANASGDMRLANVVILTQGQPDYKPAVQFHVPATGDKVPDFVLLNELGKKVSLKTLRGKVVVMTFIYTRCPLSDYCPRMSHNFAAIDKSLAMDKSLYAKTHLISVSFDPVYDTPKVLKSYGAAYTGRYANETFDHWEFAAPTVKELPQMEQWFDVGVTPGSSGTLQHSLSTVIIGNDGKIVAFWPTNDWAIQDVLSKIKAAS
jgi:protein SCO1/2